MSSVGRVDTTPEALELFGGSLDPRDRVALEVSGGAWEVARILERHVARVVVVSPCDMSRPGFRGDRVCRFPSFRLLVFLARFSERRDPRSLGVAGRREIRVAGCC